MTRLFRSLASLTTLLVAALLAGCAENAVTGRQQLFLTSPQQEAQLGQQEHPKLVQQFGGLYDNPQLAAYVTDVGNRVAAATERPDLAYSFTVLDSEIANAFALPGGYVHVTRGLLAMVNDEAELAAVLGHEIAHITARHSGERYSQTALAQIGSGLLGVVTGSPELAQLAGSGAQLYLLSYSRGQESEADAIGIRYLANSNYDPVAMAGFLQQLEREGRVQALIEGRSPEQSVSYMSTHPLPADRVRAAMSLAGSMQGAPQNRGQDAYLAMIDGMIWGGSPENGIVRGGVYGNTAQGFKWEAPPGFEIRQQGSRVVAAGPDEVLILFDQATLSQDADPMTYLREGWARGARLSGVERIDVNGFPAATGTVSLNSDRGPRDARLVAIRSGQSRMARFLFVTPSQVTGRYAEALQRATFSFSRLSDADRTAFQPLRIRVVDVRPGQSAVDLAAQTAFEDHAVERLLALNGLDDPSQIQAGRKIKLVVR